MNITRITSKSSATSTKQKSGIIPDLCSARLFLGIAIAIGFLLRAPFLSLPMISDEGGYAYAAQRWFDGRGVLYRDLIFDRPQGIFVIYGTIFEGFGSSIVTIRLAACAVSSLCLIGVWLFARRTFGNVEASLAALLFAVLSAWPSIEGFTANAEAFMALPSIICVLLLMTACRTDWPRRILIAAGLSVSVGFLVKQSGIVMLPVGLTFLGLTVPGSLSTNLRKCGWFVVGFGIALIPALAHGWAIGWHSYVHAIAGRAQTHSGGSVSPAVQLQALAILVSKIWPLVAAVLILTYALLRREYNVRSIVSDERRQGVRSPRWPLVPAGQEAKALLHLWLIGCVVGIAMGGNWFPHYLVQIIAPISVWLAVLINRLLVNLNSAEKRAFALPFVAMLILPYVLLGTAYGNPYEMGERIFDRSTYATQHEIADYINSNTKAETPIYVAFYQASIYFLADRPAADPRLYLWELQADPSVEDELVSMIEAPDRPEYVVDLAQGSPFPDRGLPFWQAIDRHYSIETTIGGARIFRALN